MTHSNTDYTPQDDMGSIFRIPRSMMTITSNEPETHGPKALLVVDILEDYTGKHATPPFPYKDSERLIAGVNTIIERVAQHNIMVIYITQEFTSLIGKTVSKLFFHGTAIQGRPGSQIDARIKVISTHRFTKSQPDAFSNPKLHAFFVKHHVHELYLVGLDAAYCLDKTAKGGVRLGYRVHIIQDSVITQFEKRWKNLLNTYATHDITLMSSHEFLESLSQDTRHGPTRTASPQQPTDPPPNTSLKS